jgi:hypothetical protein
MKADIELEQDDQSYAVHMDHPELFYCHMVTDRSSLEHEITRIATQVGDSNTSPIEMVILMQPCK